MDCKVKDSVQALRFDTTSANTGQINGACVLIEQLVSCDLLYLACRHRILELITAAAIRKYCQHQHPLIYIIQLFKCFKDN